MHSDRLILERYGKPSGRRHYQSRCAKCLRVICDREAEVRSARLRFSFSVALVRVALQVIMKVGDLELSVPLIQSGIVQGAHLQP